MGRPIILSNGSLHVGLNDNGFVHDFYYPHVGLENHSAGQGTRHKIGVWVDGNTSWLDEDAWSLTFQTADEALVGHMNAVNESAGLLIEFNNFVSSDIDAFIRTAHVVNLREEAREVRLFMHQAFVIGDTRSNHDTAQYLPDSDAILHYHGKRAFVVSGKQSNGEHFDQHSIGLFGIEGREGTYRDADDGELAGGVVEHGRVDSTIRLRCLLKPHDSAWLHYWIACGTSTRDALTVHKAIQDGNVDDFLDATVHWWGEWLKPAIRAVPVGVSSERKRQFIKSAMVVKSHIDNDGAIIASTDTTMLNYSRDAYGYCWPRDGAHALWPLIRMGYRDEALNFFDFCRAALHPGGYLMHKYQADGSLGSSWHPYVHGDIQAPPIQEDETALVLFMFVQLYQMQPSQQLIEEYYEPLVQPMATFLSNYIDEKTGLPKPTYNLWEEHFATSTYTVGTVYAALCAAGELAEAIDDHANAVLWKSAADDIRSAAHKYLFNRDRLAFYKSVLPDDSLAYDSTIDISSFYGMYAFELFGLTSPEVTATLATIRSVFNVTDERPVVPRYENDAYQRTDNNLQGNYWYVTSLWLAQYALETGDSAYAETVLEWVESRMDQTGMMAEQIDPKNLNPVSVSPLVWSHAEYLSTVLDTVNGGNRA